MIAGWRMEDVTFAVLMVAIVAFFVFCVVVGRRRWAEVRKSNARVLELSQEAISDRKKILVALEDIRAMLKERKI